MSSLQCNVVVLPGYVLAEHAIAVSSLLSQSGVMFTLSKGSFYPHVSIYMLQLDTDNFEAVGAQLVGIAKDTTPLRLKAERYWQSKQYLDASYEKSAELASLQGNVIAALNPLRDGGMRAKDVERMKQATGQALKNFKQYGWNSVGALYRPHLTLTRFVEDPNIDNLRLPNVESFSGEFTKIGLFEMGDNGTCVRKIAEFELRSP